MYDMERLIFKENYYDDEEDTVEVNYPLSGRVTNVHGRESYSERGDYSTSTNELLSGFRHDTHSGTSRGSQQHPILYRDKDVLLYKEEYYGEEDDAITQQFLLRFGGEKHRSESDGGQIGHLKNHTSRQNNEGDISEILKSFFSTVPENFGDTHNSPSDEDITPHDNQIGEDNVDLKEHPFRYTDKDLLLYEEEYYGEEDDGITQRFLSRFDCEQLHPEGGWEGAKLLNDHTYRPKEEENISEILKSVVSTIPENVVYTQTLLSNENSAPHNAQSGEDNAYLKEHPFHYTDKGILSYKEEYFDEDEDDDDAAQRHLSRFGCVEKHPKGGCVGMSHRENSTSRPNGEDISEILKRLVSTIPKNFGDTQNVSLDEDIAPHEAEFREDNAPRKKILLLPQNLRIIVRNFKKCKKSCDRFHELYPVWNSNRRGVIGELREIADTLDKTRLECNISRIIAASSGTVGGATSIAAIGLTGGSVTVPLMIAGCVVAMTGGSTALGTAIKEVILLKQQIEAVQKLLKREEHCFQNISELLRHTSEYIDSVSEIFNFDVFAEFMDDFGKLLSILGDSAKKQAKTYVLNTLFNYLTKGLSVPLTAPTSKVDYRKLAEIFKELIIMHHENHLVFESIVMTARICLQIGRSMADLPGTEVVAALVKATNIGSATFRVSMSKAITQGLFAGVGLAIDVTSLILTYIDIHKGSKCPKAEEVRRISEQLDWEFDLVKRIYAELRKCKVL